MANEIAKLFVTIGANTSEFQSKMQGLTGTLKTAGIGVATFGLAAAGAGLASAKAFASTADAIDEMSQRTGLSTDLIQEFGYAAKLTGSSMEGFEGAIKKMQRSITAADPEVAGLQSELAKLKGGEVGDQFAVIADMIQAVQDPTERAALAMEIFGKSGTDLIPMLSEGSVGLVKMIDEANALGIIMSEDAVKSGASFQDALDKLEMALGGVVNQVGSALIPILTPLIPLFMDLIKALPLKEFGELLKNLLPPLVEIFIKLTKAIPMDVVLKFVMAALTPLLNILEALMPALLPIIDLFGTLLEILTPVLNVISMILTGVAQILGSGIGTLVGGINTGLSGAMASFAGYEGIIPGIPGTPIPAIVHAGEYIGQGGGSPTYITVQGSIWSARELTAMIEKRNSARIKNQQVTDW